MSVSAVEIERRFLVPSPPPDLVPTATLRIEQGYIALEPVVRLRRINEEDFFLTMKRGAGAIREERETALTAAQFAVFWPLTEGRRLEKIRHRIPWGGFVVELDRFFGRLAGLCLAEVEFADEAAMHRFVPPAWFEAEVTDDPAYTNARLACS